MDCITFQYNGNTKGHFDIWFMGDGQGATVIKIFILNKIINAPCGTLKLLLALGFAKYIKSCKIHFVQYATDYCPLEHDNYKTISAHLGSPISCYINNLHGAFIFLLSVYPQSKHKWKPNVTRFLWRSVLKNTKTWIIFVETCYWYQTSDCHGWVWEYYHNVQ